MTNKSIRKKSLLSLLKKREITPLSNLRGMDLSYLDMSGFDLSGLDLSAVKFKKSCLRKANLRNTILKSANFCGANLGKSIIQSADCNRANFSASNLCGADFSKANLKNIHVYKTRFQYTKLDQADLSGNDLSHADLSSCVARKANFQRANLKSAHLNNADFSGSDFSGADLSESRANKVNFSGCNLRGANLEGSHLQDANLSGADLSDSNLNLTLLQRTILSGVRVRNTRMNLSWGLSSKQKLELKERGARVKLLINAKALLVLLVLVFVMGISSYLYVMDIDHLSVSVMLLERNEAKQKSQFRKALRYDFALIKKYRQNQNRIGVFNSKLDAAMMYRRIKDREKAMSILESLLLDQKMEIEKKAKVVNEMARLYIDSKDYLKAISLLKEFRQKTSGNTLYMIEMTSALAYRRLKKFDEAMNIYVDLLGKMRDNPEFVKEIKKRILSLEPKMKSVQK